VEKQDEDLVFVAKDCLFVLQYAIQICFVRCQEAKLPITDALMPQYWQQKPDFSIR
jgi:hypothetical protein